MFVNRSNVEKENIRRDYVSHDVIKFEFLMDSRDVYRPKKKLEIYVALWLSEARIAFSLWHFIALNE